MAIEIHKKNRRSFSLFSFEHFRSFSRSGNNLEHDQHTAEERALSSLSCDPHRQPAGIPVKIATTPIVASDGLIESPTAQLSSRTASAHRREIVVSRNDHVRSRPRSWVLLSRTSLQGRPSRSLSVQLPRENNFLPVSKSVISAPILIGTTNMEIAEAEGVCCRDVIDAGLNTKTQEPRAPEPDIGQSSQTVGYTKSTKLRLNRTATGRRTEENRESVPEMVPVPNSIYQSEDTWRLSNVERGIARRRAETVNLCRQKINRITGNGHVKRKDVQIDKGNTLSEIRTIGNDDIIKDPLTADANREQPNLITLGHNNSDLPLRSLNRSFTSAIDKLDFHSVSANSIMPIMKSKSSIFSIKKRVKNTADADLPESSKREDVTESNPADQTTQHASEAAKLLESMKQVQAAAQAGKSKLLGAPPEPMQFSQAANDYVPAVPATEYPGGIKALGMHSNTMDFATAPDWVTDLPKPTKHTPTLEEVTPVDDEDENEHAIQAAPIYSPSLGDLSQYARPTPSPAQPITEPGQRAEPETPTNVPAEKHHRRRLGLRKSRSGLGLLNMFNRNKGTKEKKEDRTPQARDDNQKIKGHTQLKKSRSMNFAAMLRRNEASAKKGPPSPGTPVLPSQPTNPSPLRHVARVDDDPTEEPPAPRAGFKRTPPRGQLTPADRAKRMGMIGLPEEREDAEE